MYIYVIVKMNEANTMCCSPEPYAAPTLLDPSFTPMLLPCCSSVGSTSRSRAEQHNNNIVSRDEEESVEERSQEDSAAMQHIPSSASQARTVRTGCKSDKLRPPIKTMLEQCDLFIASLRHLASDERLPKAKAARRQPEEAPPRGVEGIYLA
jgi:hypothetical protein